PERAGQDDAEEAEAQAAEGMTEPDANHELAARLLAQLGGFMLGIGIEESAAREIVQRAITDDPSLDEEGVEAKARAWMLIALA
ncbi:hypothetical protein, partial [Methylobacterium sp. E-046]|uniref:hypothetical protein n=1 Tax=Methylobacterium sp. E-046 TaxID=2836576 RepID=UPI001FB902CB